MHKLNVSLVELLISGRLRFSKKGFVKQFCHTKIFKNFDIVLNFTNQTQFVTTEEHNALQHSLWLRKKIPFVRSFQLKLKPQKVHKKLCDLFYDPAEKKESLSY
jgi:hypothetical protein